MSDHQTMYKKNGITKLYSFDSNPSIVDRQNFNAPTPQTVCRNHTSSELPSLLDEVSVELDVDTFIVWLDYTGTGARADQLAEFQSLLGNLRSGDVARITLDASLPSTKRKASLPASIRDDHAAVIRELSRQELGDFFPRDVQLLSQNDMPALLISAIERACIRAADASPLRELRYTPVLLTSYADSSPMITATIIVQDPAGEPAPPAGFQFLAQDWSTIENLEIPELTIRERTFVDVRLGSSAAEITTQFGYSIAGGSKEQRQWTSFRRFHRYLPQFQHVEIR